MHGELLHAAFEMLTVVETTDGVTFVKSCGRNRNVVQLSGGTLLPHRIIIQDK